MLLLTPFVAGLCCTIGPTPDSSFDWTGKIPVGATLRIADFDGDIDATAASGDQVEVHGWKQGDMVFQVVRDGNNVVICAYPKDDGACDARGVHGSWHGGRSPHADFTVRVPAGVVLDASTGDGRVGVRGVRSDVRAASGDGAIRVEDVDGRVVAKTGDGAIRVSTVHGAVDASSGDGDIDVDIGALAKPASMRFRTGDGTVTVVVPAAFAGELDATTGDGTIDSDLPLTVEGRVSEHRLRGTIGGGGDAHIDVSTGDGDVHLRKRS